MAVLQSYEKKLNFPIKISLKFLKNLIGNIRKIAYFSRAGEGSGLNVKEMLMSKKQASYKVTKKFLYHQLNSH
jgi:hypothetical protein